jgi:hypothetical protein
MTSSAPTAYAEAWMTAREFKLLRNRACTSGEFRSLAEWCRFKANQYRVRQLELIDAAQPLALQYRELSSHWIELSILYSEKALELESRSG